MGKMKQHKTHQRNNERHHEDGAYAPAALRMSLLISRLLAVAWCDEKRLCACGVRFLIGCDVRCVHIAY